MSAGAQGSWGGMAAVRGNDTQFSTDARDAERLLRRIIDGDRPMIAGPEVSRKSFPSSGLCATQAAHSFF